MVSLVTTLAALVTALMLLVKQAEAKLTTPTDPTQLATFQSRIDTFNLIFSMVLGVVGALVMLSNTPTLFAGDTPFIANSPVLFAIVAGLIAVLPGGASTTLLSALLNWLGAKGAPQPPAGVQTVQGTVIQGTAVPVRKTLALWS